MLKTHQSNLTTIEKTLLTTSLIDGFWDRWIVHGVDPKDLVKIRPQINTLDTWLTSWSHLAKEKEMFAEKLESVGSKSEAMNYYRIASLYYNLNQWIFPTRTNEKQKWYSEVLRTTMFADYLDNFKTHYDSVKFEDIQCPGRIRIPDNPYGVIVMINPIDSSKEELYTYEKDFNENGFITISFDGPGQGQTFTEHEFHASTERWLHYVNKLVDYASFYFNNLPIFLFGTSSGGAWSIFGSSNKKISKVAVASPATTVNKEGIRLPDYFIERLESISLNRKSILPDLEKIEYRNPILFFHGKLDPMVSDDELYGLYNKIHVEKALIEYETEGHCCNYRLQDVRRRAMKWFMEEKLQ
jgi:hypothetical protein